MKSFTDNAGRSWSVTINVETIKRVRGLLDVNLLEAVEGKLIERLVTDLVLLCDCLYAVCKPEADARGISDEEFGRGMAGDVLDQASTALLEELIDFFPQPRRTVLREALVKLRALEDRAVELTRQRLSDPRLEEQLEAILTAETSPPESVGT